MTNLVSEQLLRYGDKGTDTKVEKFGQKVDL